MDLYTIHKGTMKQLPRDYGLEWGAWAVIWATVGLLLGNYWRLS